MKFPPWLTVLQEAMRCAVTKWWRPFCCLGFVATIWTQGVVLPLLNQTSPDLTGLSLLVTSIVAAFAVREWGKHKGTAE